MAFNANFNTSFSAVRYQTLSPRNAKTSNNAQNAKTSNKAQDATASNNAQNAKTSNKAQDATAINRFLNLQILKYRDVCR